MALRAAEQCNCDFPHRTSPVTLLILFVSVCLVYTLVAALIARGIHNKYDVREDLPELSIVVPARNEEARIAGLLDTLLELDYPADLLQIVIINDQSTDRTREIAQSYRERFRCRYEVHDCVDEPDGKLVAKTRPLAQGLDRATGEVILMTDADCRVPRTWARSMVRYFASGVGMVCGTTLPNPTQETAYPLTWFETLDWLFLLGTSAGLSGSGHPQALIGNNFSVRRETYYDIGTFRAQEFTAIDDLVLLNAVEQSGRWKIVYPADEGVLIFTRPLQTLGELIRQRYRWMRGAPHVDWRGLFVITFGILTHVTWPLWPAVLGWSFLLPLGVFVAGDGMVLGRMLRRYRRARLLWLVPVYPVFAFFYGVGLVTMLLTRREIRWKDRRF